ncbi:MAG: hypothetical protein EXS31_15285 [Pedosphaera sp.]|nr:hypothetical protein [Pedosphaera sp.]
MRNYDLVMTHKLDADDFFIHCVQRHCAERGLNFFLIEPLWAEQFLLKLRSRDVRARALLNLHSEHHQPEDVFHQIVNLAFEQGTQVIDPPDVARAAFDKARLHPRLIQAGLQLPHTLIVERERIESFEFSATELEHLGSPFVVKPAMGYGKHGVILNATGPADLRRCASEWSDTHYLVQRLITPRTLGNDPAYFRVFHAFGSIWTCWWNYFTDCYRIVTESEMESFHLAPLHQISSRLAEISGMRFFSTEVAITDAGDYILIDYVNDQCHMLAQSANPRIGVPNAVVAAIAERLVAGAQGLIQNAASRT